MANNWIDDMLSQGSNIVKQQIESLGEFNNDQMISDMLAADTKNVESNGLKLSPYIDPKPAKTQLEKSMEVIEKSIVDDTISERFPQTTTSEIKSSRQRSFTSSLTQFQTRLSQIETAFS